MPGDLVLTELNSPLGPSSVAGIKALTAPTLADGDGNYCAPGIQTVYRALPLSPFNLLS